VQDSIAFNKKEFCVGPCIATDIWEETSPLVGVMGCWVFNCFVLHEKLVMSMQRCKAAQKCFFQFSADLNYVHAENTSS
jgi:hypothetical protein